MKREVEPKAVTTLANLSTRPITSQSSNYTNLVINAAANLTLDPSTSQNSNQKKDTDKLKRSNEKRPSNELRYDQRGHLPKFDQQKNATRCKKENCESRTHVYCVKCNVHLCIAKNKHCFNDFHVLALPKD